MDEKNLMNFDGLSDVAVKLLDMIEKTVGWIAIPKGSKADFYEGLRVYKEGILNDKNLSYLEKGIKISTATRELKEYIREYITISAAINNLSLDAEPFKIDPDWLNTLFSYARNCSDDYMQTIWGQLLAAKANNTCSIPKRVLHIFACIEKEDIDTFCKLCSITFDNLQRESSCYPFVYIKKHPSYYNSLGIRRYHLASLSNLGLIEYDIHGSFVLPKDVPDLGYSNIKIRLYSDSRIPYGNIRLTQAGRALYNITDVNKDEDFLKFCFEIWKKEKIHFTTEQL